MLSKFAIYIGMISRLLVSTSSSILHHLCLGALPLKFLNEKETVPHLVWFIRTEFLGLC
jgi:hypothetical protein